MNALIFSRFNQYLLRTYYTYSSFITTIEQDSQRSYTQSTFSLMGCDKEGLSS